MRKLNRAGEEILEKQQIIVILAESSTRKLVPSLINFFRKKTWDYSYAPKSTSFSSTVYKVYGWAQLILKIILQKQFLPSIISDLLVEQINVHS